VDESSATRTEAHGVLIDQAQGLVSQKIPDISTAQLEDQIRLADAETRRLGLTMVHDAGVDPLVVETYKRMVDKGELKTRLYVMLSGPLDRLETEFQKGPIKDYAKRHLMVQAIKIVADGALGSRGAALLEPYSDEPRNTGLLTTPPEEVHAKTLAASKAGFQTCIHAIGDRANREVLDIYEKVYAEAPVSRNLRLRIEHAQILDAADIPRFARMNVIASMQTTHATSDMPWVPTRIGAERTAEGAYVWQKLMKSGAMLANGSDFPVEEPNPMLGFYAGITRQDPDGNPPGGWMPDERLSRPEVLKAFTWNAAFAAHAETELGLDRAREIRRPGAARPRRDERRRPEYSRNTGADDGDRRRSRLRAEAAAAITWRNEPNARLLGRPIPIEAGPCDGG
jgi:predicted amidohydrolase YtcJ